MSFVTGQEDMSCFNHFIPYIHNLALDSNSSGKQALDGKSAIFFTPETWNHNSMFTTSLNFVTRLLTYYMHCFFTIWVQHRAIAESVRHISCATSKSVDNMEWTLLIYCVIKRLVINCSWGIATGLIGANIVFDAMTSYRFFYHYIILANKLLLNRHSSRHHRTLLIHI